MSCSTYAYMEIGKVPTLIRDKIYTYYDCSGRI